ncbi:hypothetical protein ACRAWF_07025 [Streptomyces sp. L7]
MATARDPGVQPQMEPLSVGTQIRLQGGIVKTVLAHRYYGKTNALHYLIDKQTSDWRPAVLYPRPARRHRAGRRAAASAAGPAATRRAAGGPDHHARHRHRRRPPERQRPADPPHTRRTAGDPVSRPTRLFGPSVADHPQILNLTTATDSDFTSQARLTIGDYQQDDSGLRVNVLIEGVLDKVADPHDLIEIVLTKPLLIPTKPTEDIALETMLVLTPPVNENRIQFDAFYTWAQLARLLGLPTAEGDLRHRVCTVFPQLGVEARWYDRLASGANGVLHTSGGNKLKDGSGQIAMRPITQDDRKASEVVRNTDWNLSEVLRASRPVYVTYRDLLQPGKEMATTLEAESEFLVRLDQYGLVLSKLTELLHTPGLWPKLGITDLKCDDLDKETGKAEPRVSKDSYFDVPGLPLLTEEWCCAGARCPRRTSPGCICSRSRAVRPRSGRSGSGWRPRCT